jgi:hypothetical protein
MKIVMLGNSGAGKTTYLSLMYDEMRGGVAGFEVRAREGGHHRQLLTDARAIRSSRYPPPTNRRDSFDFALSYAGEEVLPFTWRDHRGGAASGRTADGEDVAQLHADLKESDGIVMFIDGHALVHETRAARQAARLSSHVLRAMKDRPEVLTPLVVAITKCDLIDTADDKVGEAIIAPLNELISAVAATKHILGTVIGVSCGPRPENVAVPVLWSLRFGIIGMAMRLKAAMDESAAQANRAAANDWWLDRLVSKITQEDSWADIAQRHRRSALRAHADLQALIKPAEGLDKLLKGVPGF